MPNLLTPAIEVIWFFLPAFAGNIAPVLAAYYHWLPRLNVPVDGGLTLGRSRLLGQNKTVRGFVVGIAAGMVTGAIQSALMLALAAPGIGLFHYGNLLAAAGMGGLVAFGALLGDAIKSFYKRRVRIPAGMSWKPWDQVDIVIGVLLATAWFVPFTLTHVVIIFVVTGLGMFLTSTVGYSVGIKQAV